MLNILRKNKKNGIKSAWALGLLLQLFLESYLSAEISAKKKLMFHFDKIEVRGAINVFVEPGPRNRQIEYFASSEIIDAVEARVSGRTLYLDANNTFNLTRRIPLIRLSAQRVFPIEVMVNIDSLKEIRLLEQSSLSVKKIHSEELSIFSKSTGNLVVSSIKCPIIKLRQEGEGSVTFRGRDTQFLQAKVFNSGELNAEELFLDTAEISHHGSGNLFLAPSSWLDVKILGSGNLTLFEKPEGIVVHQSSGSGKIINLYE